MSSVEAPVYEVRCPHCEVSFPIGTRRCVHCGEPTEKPRREAGVAVQAGGAEGRLPTGADATDEQEDAPVARGAARGMALLWIVLAVAASLYRQCTAPG